MSTVQSRWMPAPAMRAAGTDKASIRARGRPSVEAAAAPAPAQARKDSTVNTVRNADRPDAADRSTPASLCSAGTYQSQPEGSASIIEKAGPSCCAVKTRSRAGPADELDARFGCGCGPGPGREG